MAGRNSFKARPDVASGGEAMLEFIIVAAPMLAVVMLLVDFGRGLNYQQVMWARRVAPTAADLQAVFELIASKILMRLPR